MGKSLQIKQITIRIYTSQLVYFLCVIFKKLLIFTLKWKQCWKSTMKITKLKIQLGLVNDFIMINSNLYNENHRHPNHKSVNPVERKS